MKYFIGLLLLFSISFARPYPQSELANIFPDTKKNVLANIIKALKTANATCQHPSLDKPSIRETLEKHLTAPPTDQQVDFTHYLCWRYLITPSQAKARRDKTKSDSDKTYTPNKTSAPKKPIIYLYPKEPTKVSLYVDLQNGQVTTLYPAYQTDSGWQIDALPGGTLRDTSTMRTYYGLYWEGIMNESISFDTGVVVQGKETRAYLEKALYQLGLNDFEANEMIMYWLPRLESNAFNLIHFAREAYVQAAPLIIDPVPDTQIRLLMLYKPLIAPIKITPQVLPDTPPARQGFTLVEWGGAELKNLPERLLIE